ncbi:MAG: hypothetical protein P1U87_12055 [Verrucomicrobiales bacterium]|nr:hypothetical protein [Verrucomicrobiales bacterium]
MPSLPAAPQLQEKWYVETYHESSTYKAYEGLRVRYEVELEQVGSLITVVGEKMGEVYRNGETENSGKARTPIFLSGTLQWEDDMWIATLEGKEGSTTRSPFPVVAKIKFPGDSDLPENALGMGECSSTAASASGPAI